jgi:hypothetical protein
MIKGVRKASDGMAHGNDGRSGDRNNCILVGDPGVNRMGISWISRKKRKQESKTKRIIFSLNLNPWLEPIVIAKFEVARPFERLIRCSTPTAVLVGCGW